MSTSSSAKMNGRARRDGLERRTTSERDGAGTPSRRPAGARRARAALLAAAGLVLGGCSQKGEWLIGQWLLIDEDGKPGVCHEFKKDRNFVVYTTAECSGTTDQTSSGKWEVKEENKLALQRFNERKAGVVLVTEKDKERFIARGALAGTLWRLGKAGAQEVLTRLEAKGAIKVKPLPGPLGCDQLALQLNDIRRLPTEPEPRMLRQKDTGLVYHQGKGSAEAKVEKVVYALNGDQLEWMALHLTPEAFNPPGPQARLEESLGKPTDAIATGEGEKRQHIVIWKAYCAPAKDVPKRDVDATLFATAGAKRGTIYVSENVISGIWEDLKLMTKDPGAQATEEEEGGEGGEATKKAGGEPKKTGGETKPEPKKAEPKKAEPKQAEPKQAEPKQAEPKKAGKKAGGADDDDI